MLTPAFAWRIGDSHGDQVARWRWVGFRGRGCLLVFSLGLTELGLQRRRMVRRKQHRNKGERGAEAMDTVAVTCVVCLIPLAAFVVATVLDCIDYQA